MQNLDGRGFPSCYHHSFICSFFLIEVQWIEGNMQSVAKNLVTTAASATYGIIQVRMDMNKQGIMDHKGL